MQFSHILKVYPGLSTFEDNVPGIKDYIKDLVKRATENVPRDSWNATPIHLFATAGKGLS